MKEAVRIALASPRVATSLHDGLERVERLLAEAAARGAAIACFPEAYLPGLRGQDFEVPPFERADHDRVLGEASRMARAAGIGVVLGAERLTEGGRQIASYVIDRNGEVVGLQTKNQLDPSEDRFYVPGAERRVFEVGGVRFGIAICHEGFRYPETVRWAAARGASVVFHPHHTGSDREGVRRRSWGEPDAPYYEKAMACRALENGIYFASVNVATRFQDSATSLVGPSGACEAHLPYGEEGVLVAEIHPARASAVYARRYAPERYRDADAG